MMCNCRRIIPLLLFTGLLAGSIGWCQQQQRRVPAGVKYLPDLSYREGNPAWKLDLAMPDERGPAPRPGMVIIHGGGWVSGDKRTGMWGDLPLEYAQHGYVTVSLNYRFATEAPLPACIEDVKCAVRWLRAQAKEYNLDPRRIGGFGNSAGAHLVAMLALSGPQAGLEGDGPYQDQPSSLQAACVAATPADFSNWGSARPGGPERGAGRLFGASPETAAERARRCSPVTYASAAAPPFLVIHGNADSTVPVSQAERLVKALREAGARNVTYMLFDGANHNVFAANSPMTRAAMRAFFDGILRPEAGGK